MQRLKETLSRIDGSSYKNYKQLKGYYRFEKFTLYIDHVQGDPFAKPSPVRCRVDRKLAGVPDDCLANRIRRTALADYLIRKVREQIGRFYQGSKGSGKSGLINIYSGNQEVLERTALSVNDSFLEARLQVGLPAFGRRVNARGALQIFFEELPQAIEKSLLFTNLDLSEIRHHLAVVEDQDFLRQRLDELGLVACLGEGALLPRRSGIDDRPLAAQEAVRFTSPGSLRCEVSLPNRGRVTGMGIPRGVTLIVGGGYHGKSTLLKAIERGVYNQIPGDGRELVVTVPRACKIRAEDGRSITQVDISPFINNLPLQKSTEHFCSVDASGSTSQAANIMEAVELGADLLLLDEDTSATNFLVRDARMQALVAKEKEPIIPFIDRVQELSREQGISTIMVIGGAGDYFEVADRVIMLDQYHPLDVTREARAIVEKFPSGRAWEGTRPFTRPAPRVPLPSGFPRPRGQRPLKVQARHLHCLSYAKVDIDLAFLEQLVDEGQTRAIAAILLKEREGLIDGRSSLQEIIVEIEKCILAGGLDHYTPASHPVGDLALPRGLEIAATINRLRGLRIAQPRDQL